MYFATLSLLLGAPVLIRQVFSATARSAIVVSAVSPERWEEAVQEEVHRRYLTVGEMDGRIREDAK